MAGEAVGSSVELSVGEHGAVVNDRGLPGRPCRALRDPAVYRREGGGALPGCAAFGEELCPLSVAQQIELPQAPAGIGRRGGKEPLIALEQAHHRRLVEKAAVVGETGHQRLVGALRQGQTRFEDRRTQVGALVLGPEGRESEPAHGQLLTGQVLHQEHDLERRRAVRVALPVEALQHFFKRQVLMGEGSEGRIAGARQHLLEGRIPGQVRAQQQGVEEEADQPFRLEAAAIGDGRADQHVLLGRGPGEQGVPAGEERHVERRRFAA